MSNNYKRVVTHSWNVIQRFNNVVLLKCTCCQQPRIGVAKQREIERNYDGTKVTIVDNEFYYHGYDYNYAEQLYNKLIKQRNDNHEDDYDNEEDNNYTTSSNSKRDNDNDHDKVITINNVSIRITNPRFHLREKK